MKLQKDIREFVTLLLSRKVEFLLVDGYALAFHGAPRFTEGIDLLEPDQVIHLGRAPNRIDLLTGISGVPWETAWTSRIEANFDGFTIPVIGKSALEANKEASGRPRDLADLARLRKHA